MPGGVQPGERAPAADAARGEAAPAGLAHLEQAAQQAQLRQYGALAAIGQLALAGHPFPLLARETLVQLLETLGLLQGAVLECRPGARLQCMATLGLTLPEGMEGGEGAWGRLLGTASLKAELLGEEGTPVALAPLVPGAQGLLVRVPDPAGAAVAVLVLVTPQGWRAEAGVLAFLQAAAHLLGAAVARERREVAQRSEVARLEALLDHAPAAICLKDLEGRYTYVNRRFAGYLRINGQKALGHTDEDLFPAATAQLMRVNDGEVRGSGRAQEFEEEMELPEGRLTFVVVRFPVYDAYGQLSATGLVATDITELKRVERELRHSEEQLRLLVDGLKDHAVFMLDPEGRVASWSRGAERLKGYRPEEILGKPVSLLIEVEGDASAAVRASLAKAVRVGRVELVSVCVRRDGSRFLSNDTVHPLWAEDGSLRGFSVVSQDVTQRKQAERRLRQSEERYRLVSRATHDAIWDWDVVRNEVEWGEGALARFGYTDGEHARYLQWWEARIHPDEREAVLTGLARALSQGGERWSAEYRFLRADGTYAWVRDHAYVVREGERPVRVIGAMSDITRRRRAEEERSRLYREAQEAIRLRDEFLSVASHELKTPITTLQLHLQTLRVLASRDAGAFTPERAFAKLTLAEQQIHRLAKLVNDLLDISRLNSGRMELRFETVNVGSLLEELVERQADALRRAGSEVHLQVRDARVARVDPMRLEQILTNLLSNAAKYGQGRPIDITLEGDEERYSIRVQDRGIGIAPEDLQRIFERFERAVSERHYGGLGLGLWITQQIVMNLGGTIEVQSTLGEGATFTVRLPRFPAEASLTQLAEAPVAT